jgi:DNA-binding MarR family transcriptional regulator
MYVADRAWGRLSFKDGHLDVALTVMRKTKTKTRDRVKTAARVVDDAFGVKGAQTARPGKLVDSALLDESARRLVHDGGDSDHIEIRIWLRLLSCTTRIENVLKSRMRREFGTSLARFDVLAQLDRFANGLTMTELSLRLLVSNGAITGLVEKLVADRLVFREGHSKDKRTIIVRLTAKGSAIFRKMALRHEEWVISLLSDLSREARVELLHNLMLLKRRLDGVPGKSGRIDAAMRELMLADEKAS